MTDAPSAPALSLVGRIMPASNATFLAELGSERVVYKPIAGERPLWDFPDGTLAGREVAAYHVSTALGWDVVPRTWLGEGPHGLGMIQQWREPDPDVEPVDVVPAGAVPPGYLPVLDALDADHRPVTLVHEDSAALRRMAVFDVLINNADRKGGHVLAMPDGHRYGVDHGLGFHVEDKLRSVLWGWAGQPLSAAEHDGVRRLLSALAADLGTRLADLITPAEVDMLATRADALLRSGALPSPPEHRAAIPWPAF